MQPSNCCSSLIQLGAVRIDYRIWLLYSCSKNFASLLTLNSVCKRICMSRTGSKEVELFKRKYDYDIKKIKDEMEKKLEKKRNKKYTLKKQIEDLKTQ